MTSPHHLDHEQRRTLERIASHPLPRNLKWQQVLSLLRAVAEEFEEHDDRYRVTVNGHTEVFHVSHRADVPADTVVKLRHFLADPSPGLPEEP